MPRFELMLSLPRFIITRRRVDMSEVRKMPLLEQHALPVENRGNDIELLPRVLVFRSLLGNPNSIADDDWAIASAAEQRPAVLLEECVTGRLHHPSNARFDHVTHPSPVVDFVESKPDAHIVLVDAACKAPRLDAYQVVRVVHPNVFAIDSVGFALLGAVGRNRVMSALACIEEEVPEHTPIT
ncbi:hypothetical protein JM946_00510 [Steroidobacter sp. S1-65]|uniref:Uncharacterized protein n=1 Tax=Steroidobacter gossypii TaxID=2805490 RepID=A0ABS1WQF2_9GAMM|nr:hypothetical protein [Steroidobacter gossypii]MBM0103201.1 hypothetical protein [Steroidobacter gossypii]